MPHAKYDRWSNATCTPDHGVAGVYCVLCADKAHIFASGRCYACNVANGLAAFGALAVLLAVCTWVWRRRLAGRIAFRAKLRIVVSFNQSEHKLKRKLECKLKRKCKRKLERKRHKRNP
jgi:hypothetical protein